jgi:hypothetical protein
MPPGDASMFLEVKRAGLLRIFNSRAALGVMRVVIYYDRWAGIRFRSPERADKE